MIDLAGHAPRLFDWEDEELTTLTAQVAAADVAIFASPTYKAAYTGMLKAFLDRYGSNGLAGITAVPVMTGGWPGHLLAVEVHLRPVLVELGATSSIPRPVRDRARASRPGRRRGEMVRNGCPADQRPQSKNKFKPVISNGPCPPPTPSALPTLRAGPDARRRVGPETIAANRGSLPAPSDVANRPTGTSAGPGGPGSCWWRGRWRSRA